MRLKYKLLLAGMVTCLIIITIISLQRSSVNDNKLATVLSTEPIKSHRLIEHENCSVIGVLDGFSQDYLSRYHPAQRECKTVFMLEILQNKSLPKLIDKEYRNCVITQKIEQIIVGYDVVYRIGDTLGKVRTPYDPGLLIPLDKDGRLDLSASSNQLCDAVNINADALVPLFCIKADESRIQTLNNAVEIFPRKNAYGYFE
ncbi:UmoD family flagellar biogenesis regulator [Providencia burhodogranariea]|uniref:Uncharacterized protein n=1 Tax=Providencia burhodogranariea DSM 19968 TaxID=1141662 RepID=K8X6B4_9GAMM|nr:UmoD family flagellar biogenesis regulator [Providencia burhodogranariea]EKT63985.1 hypothetical protein OOA_03959 [Providencia burhodogranariea DSM 19968]